MAPEGRCPAGHASATTDYCDECGAPMGAAATPVAPPPPPVDSGLTCASCGEPRSGRFCEACGADADLPTAAPDATTVLPAAGPVASGPVPSEPVTSGPGPTGGEIAGSGLRWVAVVRADRDWFDAVLRRDGPDAAGLAFPPFAPERRFDLTGSQLTIGRRSRSRGVDPEIDLSGPPTDPGVSTLHALLLARAGGWDIVDLDSTNGTVLDDAPDPIRPNAPVPLAAGTVIRIGAWTTITIGTR